jgi:phosphoribosyl 1,2-cyclic phosphodiesterase
MRVKLWGVRGSIPSPGMGMARYGGNTSCVEVTLKDGTELVLDAGSGIRDLGGARASKKWNILLTHLHMDHIQGLMFFSPLFNPECETVVWGASAPDGPLRSRLARYISAPLSPIEMRELPGKVSFETCPVGVWEIGGARVEAMRINHRGPTFGYRIIEGDTSLCYLPDHEPTLGQPLRGTPDDWISGLSLAKDASLLIHDAQYTEEEYPDRVGWGHSRVRDAVEFSRRTGAERVAFFHHDPQHDDVKLDAMNAEAQEMWSELGGEDGCASMAIEGRVFEI